MAIVTAGLKRPPLMRKKTQTLTVREKPPEQCSCDDDSSRWEQTAAPASGSVSIRVVAVLPEALLILLGGGIVAGVSSLVVPLSLEAAWSLGLHGPRVLEGLWVVRESPSSTLGSDSGTGTRSGTTGNREKRDNGVGVGVSSSSLGVFSSHGSR